MSTMAYRIGPSGAINVGPVFLYGYSFATDGARIVKSITLPNNRNVVVLAVNAGVTPDEGPPPIALLIFHRQMTSWALPTMVRR